MYRPWSSKREEGMRGITKKGNRTEILSGVVKKVGKELKVATPQGLVSVPKAMIKDKSVSPWFREGVEVEVSVVHVSWEYICLGVWRAGT